MSINCAGCQIADWLGLDVPAVDALVAWPLRAQHQPLAVNVACTLHRPSQPVGQFRGFIQTWPAAITRRAPGFHGTGCLTNRRRIEIRENRDTDEQSRPVSGRRKCAASEAGSHKHQVFPRACLARLSISRNKSLSSYV